MSTFTQMLIGNTLSIHAPREGGDANFQRDILDRCQFQSTLPVGGATAKIHKSICIFLKIMPLNLFKLLFCCIVTAAWGTIQRGFLRITGAKGAGDFC